MDARFYNSDDIEIERLANDVVNVFLSQNYQAQQFGDSNQRLVQIKKGGDFEAIIGMQAAVSLTLQKNSGGVLAMIGQQRWIDKAAVGAVGIVAFPVLWPLALTAGAGAIRQASLGNNVLNVVDGLVRQQRPGIQAGPVPMQLLPGVQSQWGQPPALPAPQAPYYTPSNAQAPYYTPSQPQVVNATPVNQPAISAPADSQLRCPQCNTPYEAGDTFCSGCGKALATPRIYCSNCHTELKPGVAFCPKCGASTFQAANSPTPPVQNRPVTPTNTPPAQQRPPTPVYVPSPQQSAPPSPPAQPAYVPPVTQTPPVVPQPKTYYVPSNNQQVVDASAPTIASQPAAPAPKKPEEPYYVPPVTQEPTIQPQPKVTMVPGKPNQAPPPSKPRPQKQYYIPSNQAQQSDTVPATPAQSSQSAQVPAPSAANAPWGGLTFSTGQYVELTQAQSVVGRYDHDLGGERPAVDLSDFQNSDTVSRVHALLEHTGNTYTLTDLNSTNATRINGKRLTPDQDTPINDGDTLQFGKITATFKRL
jgi:hypothetical protein